MMKIRVKIHKETETHSHFQQTEKEKDKIMNNEDQDPTRAKNIEETIHLIIAEGTAGENSTEKGRGIHHKKIDDLTKKREEILKKKTEKIIGQAQVNSQEIHGSKNQKNIGEGFTLAIPTHPAARAGPGTTMPRIGTVMLTKIQPGGTAPLFLKKKAPRHKIKITKIQKIILILMKIIKITKRSEERRVGK